MPTAHGGETIGERLERLRTERTRARAVVEKAETNGQAFSIGGVSVTQVAVERAEERIIRLDRQIRSLEARLAGGRGATGMAVTVTRIES